MGKPASDRYLRMYGPLLDVLRELGGEGKAGEVARQVADRVLAGSPERERVLKSGGNASENEVAWARNNLRVAGLIDASVPGIWRLTESGWNTHIPDLPTARAIGLNRDIVARLGNPEVEPEQDSDEEQASEDSAAPTLIETLLSLPPQGFERLCRHILQRSGFVQVEVTGQTGDGGIDGRGLLQLNELVSFLVLFQCKRVQGSIGSDVVRNFRGAMSGRTDKGIIISTGTFTSEARKEALREGVPPIELVDREALVSLMERLQIGLRPRTVFDVDYEFFERFRLLN